MPIDPHDPRPIYIQIAEEIKNRIGAEQLSVDDRVPSTNEISAFYTVNPTTAAKALTQLHKEGLVTKKRGLGMFVSPSAREMIMAQRQELFAQRFIRPLVRESRALGMSTETVKELITKEMRNEQTD
ncbi:GntR family transcriptional regulator [Corynebacterium sp. ED61]|uniref:GntR family transcriptional regulator n=1 Tax=Corynebacterium sp. ED61 TaxID=2211360 RepID=UPI0018846AB9|nr:GntR family transcriptional regulator [Corynebacterium sp. ED61]MBF0582373.1 GntR family transcriptional regulator [Corynebacterium sp. ED61]